MSAVRASGVIVDGAPLLNGTPLKSPLLAFKRGEENLPLAAARFNGASPIGLSHFFSA